MQRADAAVHYDGGRHVCNLCLSAERHSEPVTDLRWQPSGGRGRAGADADGGLNDAADETGADEPRSINSADEPRSINSAEPRSLTVHPKKPLLASASRDGTVRLWRGDDCLAVYSGGAHFSSAACRICATGFSPDGATMFSCSADGVLRVWSPGAPSEQPLLITHPCAIEAAVASLPGASR